MGNILRSEFFRVRKSGITRGIEIFFAVTTIFWGLLYLFEKVNQEDLEEIRQQGFETFAGFPSGTLYFLILAFFAGGLLTGDYTTGAIKQIASRGVERRKILLGQYIVVSAYMTGITLLAATVRALIVTLFWGAGKDFTFPHWLFVNLGWLVVIWSYSAFAVLVAHLIRSGAGSILLHICLLVGGNLASTVVVTILALNGQEELSSFISDIWLLEIQFNALDYSQSAASQLLNMGLLLLFGLVSLGAAVYLFEKRDVA